MISLTYDIIGPWYHRRKVYDIRCDIIYDIIAKILWYHISNAMISLTYDIICQWYHNWYHVISFMISWMISWHLHLWYHRSESMISLTCDIMGQWYHSQYHVISTMISFMILMHPNLWYHESKSMISLTYDIRYTWCHSQYHQVTLPKHMIFGMISFQCVYTHLLLLALQRRGCSLGLGVPYAPMLPFGSWGCRFASSKTGDVESALGVMSFPVPSSSDICCTPARHRLGRRLAFFLLFSKVLWLDAVRGVVLFEVEQATCMHADQHVRLEKMR